MPRTNSSIQIRAANRRDIPAIVEIATSSVDEDEDVGFGTVRSESLFTDVSRLSAAWRDYQPAGQGGRRPNVAMV